MPLLLLAAMACGFYVPQVVAGTTLWDGADVHYSAQRYLSNSLHAGQLPFWTPYLFAGFPFLADLQVGAWYPLNWPFFAAGTTPNSMSGELLLHTIVACFGAYALAMRLLHERCAAVAAALFYGLSGYFAAHSQHVGLYQAAAWLPWLVLVVDAIATRFTITRVVLLGWVVALLALPGHFQTALYAVTFSALFVVLDAVWLRTWSRLLRAAIGLAAGCTLAAALAAIMVLPGLELVGESVRTQLNASDVDIGYFHVGSLVTLVWPDYYGLLSGTYHGPGDSTQHYFYAGIAFVPLAALGLHSVRARRLAVLLGLPFLWYALGPAGGLFSVVSRLPGFKSIELPMHGWFLPALGLALLAGAGMARLPSRLTWPLVALTFVDVLIANQLLNPLAYAHQTSDERYGAPLRAFEAQLAAAQPPVGRLDGPQYTPIGYRNYQLQARVETTYGYNPLELRRFADYMTAAGANARLLDALGVTHELSFTADGTAVLQPRSTALPLATFPRDVTAFADEDAVRAQLRGLDSAHQALVQQEGVPAERDTSAFVTVQRRDEASFELQYRAADPGLMRVAVAWFPGWQASLNGSPVPVVPVDEALLGVIVPPGEGVVRLSYGPRYFPLAALLSAAAFLSSLVALLVAARQNQCVLSTTLRSGSPFTNRRALSMMMSRRRSSR